MKKFNKWLFAFISLFGIVATLNIPKVNAEKYYNNAYSGYCDYSIFIVNSQ